MKYLHEEYLKKIIKECNHSLEKEFNPKEQFSLFREEGSSFETFKYLKNLGLIRIRQHETSPGIMVVQLTYEGLYYFKNKRKNARELWIKNAWIPIIVAFLTTALSNYILPKLWQILQCYIDAVSKTP